ncbi:hypothetical protein BGX29_001068 [Mortierella sp. GBA35]|nr:hypothetical protein BGX29_001068 [Mortierella sp. GBA35]
MTTIRVPTDNKDFTFNAIIEYYNGLEDSQGNKLITKFEQRVLSPPFEPVSTLLSRIQAELDQNEKYEGFVATRIQSEDFYDVGLWHILYTMLDNESTIRVFGHLPVVETDKDTTGKDTTGKDTAVKDASNFKNKNKNKDGKSKRETVQAKTAKISDKSSHKHKYVKSSGASATHPPVVVSAKINNKHKHVKSSDTPATCPSVVVSAKTNNNNKRKRTESSAPIATDPLVFVGSGKNARKRAARATAAAAASSSANAN